MGVNNPAYYKKVGFFKRKEMTSEEIIAKYGVVPLPPHSKQLKGETERLKKIIDKAIEYIEAEKVVKDVNVLYAITKYEKDLLDILKGEDKE